MSRVRVIYPVEALYAGPTPATGTHWVGSTWGNMGLPGAWTNNKIEQITRVQSCNYSLSVPRQNVSQFGEYAPIERVAGLQSPTVPISFSYLLANLSNERKLGFSVTQSGANGLTTCLAGILNKTQDDRNYFLKILPEGSEANGDTTNVGTTIGIGNAFLTSYSVQAAVNDLPSVTVNAEGLNIVGDPTFSGNHIPAINPTDGTEITGWHYQLPTGTRHVSGFTTQPYSISVLRPGDVTFSIKNAGTATDYGGFIGDISDIKIQSFNVSFDMSREQISKLGTKYAYAKELNYPINVTAAVDAIMGDISTSSGTLVDVISADAAYDIYFAINQPGTTSKQVQYVVKGAKLESQSYNSALGGSKTVNLNFAAQIGGPNTTDVGLFMSGVC